MTYAMLNLHVVKGLRGSVASKEPILRSGIKLSAIGEMALCGRHYFPEKSLDRVIL